jgi:AcrR family transcriptional regulator
MDATEAGVKDKLFWAAVRAFAAKGYKGATVRAVCREAGGVNVSAVQYYFGGKDKLYQAVLEVLFTAADQRFRQRLLDEAQAGAGPEERLRLLIEVYCQVLFAHGEVGDAFLRLWAMELANPTPFLGDMVERHSRPQTLAMLGLMAEFAGPDAPVTTLVAMMSCVLGPCLYQALLWPNYRRIVSGHPPMAERWPVFAEHCFRHALAGLRAVGQNRQGGAS